MSEKNVVLVSSYQLYNVPNSMWLYILEVFDNPDITYTAYSSETDCENAFNHLLELYCKNGYGVKVGTIEHLSSLQHANITLSPELKIKWGTVEIK